MTNYVTRPRSGEERDTRNLLLAVLLSIAAMRSFGNFDGVTGPGSFTERTNASDGSSFGNCDDALARSSFGNWPRALLHCMPWSRSDVAADKPPAGEDHFVRQFVDGRAGAVIAPAPDTS